MFHLNAVCSSVNNCWKASLCVQDVFVVVLICKKKLQFQNVFFVRPCEWKFCVK